MSRLWIRFYNQQRDRIVESMKRDTKDTSAPKHDVLFWDNEATKQGKADPETHPKTRNKWSSRAACFEDTFNFVREKSEPSNWILAAYLVHHTGLVVFRSVRTAFEGIRMAASLHYRFWRCLLITNKSLGDKKDESTAEKRTGSSFRRIG